MARPHQWLGSIQYLRGICVLMVVVWHAVVNANFYAGPSAIWDPAESLVFLLAGVDIFFVISGFLMVHVFSSPLSGKMEVKPWEFLLRRIIRIYPAYWIYSLLFLAVFLSGSMFALTNTDIPSPAFMVKSLLLVPQEQWPLLFVAWTLVYEVLFYLLFTLALCFFVSRNLTVAAVSAALITLVMIGVASGTGGTSPEVLNPLLNGLFIEFVFGMLLALSWSPRRSSSDAFYVVCVLCGFCGVALLFSTSLFVSVDSGGTLYGQGRVWFWGLPAALVVFSVVHMERMGACFALKPLLRLGEASYTLYLTHMIFIPVGGKIWQEMGLDDVFDTLLLIGCHIAFSVMIGLWLYSRVEKPMLKKLSQFVARFAHRSATVADNSGDPGGSLGRTT